MAIVTRVSPFNLDLKRIKNASLAFTHQEIADLIGVSTKTVQRITNLAFIQLSDLPKSYGAADYEVDSGRMPSSP